MIRIIRSKEEVRKARDRYIEMGAAAGFEMAPITYAQKQKGVDNLYKHRIRHKRSERWSDLLKFSV